MLHPSGGRPIAPRSKTDNNGALRRTTDTSAGRGMTTRLKTPDAPAQEAHRLSTLLEVSQALSGTLNLKASLHRVLEILGRHHGAVRGIVSLVQPDGALRVEASDGLGGTPRAIRYQLGEGITGRVVQSGKPVVVPRVSREP